MPKSSDSTFKDLFTDYIFDHLDFRFIYELRDTLIDEYLKTKLYMYKDEMELEHKCKFPVYVMIYRKTHG